MEWDSALEWDSRYLSFKVITGQISCLSLMSDSSHCLEERHGQLINYGDR